MRNKYYSKKIEVNGIVFDSKKEAKRFASFLNLEQNISDFKPVFTEKKFGDNSDFKSITLDIETYNAGVVSEQFLDKNGRTILWRRFNRNDWAFDTYGKLWSEQLPGNEQLIINGQTYVQWYDCITDYIL